MSQFFKKISKFPAELLLQSLGLWSVIFFYILFLILSSWCCVFGCFVCVGTYQLAICAKYHRIPFYVASPTTTLDPHKPSGEAIPIEERPSREMTSLQGVQLAPEGQWLFLLFLETYSVVRKGHDGKPTF